MNNVGMVQRDNRADDEWVYETIGRVVGWVKTTLMRWAKFQWEC